MPGRRLGFPVLALALSLAASACSFTDEEEERVVCAPEARIVLVAEKLTRLEPSTPFDVAPGQDVWVSVVGDFDYNPSALFSGVASLFLIEAGNEPRIREDSNDLFIIDDPAIRFEAEGDWRPATAVPGRYQVWSTGGPIIEVAACPTPVNRD